MDRFARASDLGEIPANNFNLNISQFGDAAEPVEAMAKSKRPIFYPQEEFHILNPPLALELILVWAVFLVVGT